MLENFRDNKDMLSPALVGLYDSHKVYALAEDKSPEARAQLADLVVELLGSQISKREQDIVTDILLRLIREAEVGLKETIAERLSVIEDAPSQLVLELAYEDISISSKILSNSPVLETLDLLYIISSRDAPYWRAVAKRSNMDADVVDALADVNDIKTHELLAGNSKISLTEKACKKLAVLAKSNIYLARNLSLRNEVSDSLKAEIAMLVGQSLKESLSTQLDLSQNVQNVINETLNDLSNSSNDFSPTYAMMVGARKLATQGVLNYPSIEKSLLRGQYKYFVAKLSVYCGMKPEKILEILSDGSGEKVAALAKSQCMELKVLYRLLMNTHKFRNSSREEEVILKQGVKVYKSISREDAQRLLAD